MKNKIVLLILILVSLFTLVSCGEEETPSEVIPTPDINDNNSNVEDDNKDEGNESITPDEPTTVVIEEYTITWINYDGTVLETDEAVKAGTIPTYDGMTPEKEGNTNVSYIFSGWDPEVSEAICDTTYTATFIEITDDFSLEGALPTFIENKNNILYGLYPQTHVNDESMIAVLNELEVSSLNNWYYYEGSYYAKEVASVYNSETYTFDDGTVIVDGMTYWFKCEAISWDILSYDGVSYYLVTSKLLDSQAFYKDYNNRNNDGTIVYSNNYEYSDIRNWLNGYFYETAFALNNLFIKESNLDNSAKTTDSPNNKYAGTNTLDKVFLPTYEDYLNASYGFEVNSGVSDKRECMTTDYARARGAWYNKKDSNLTYNGSYWTRSATSEYSYCVWNVNTAGFLSTYAVDGSEHSVRPAIYIYFQ